MRSLSIGILAGIVAGVITAYSISFVSGHSNSPAKPLIRDIGDARPVESAEVAEYRDRRFSDLLTIESLQTLPGDYVRSEALHALCGRSNSEDLVRLANDAARIEDPHWRERALEIIFQRLTELAPASALELSRSGVFFNIRSAQTIVLQTWARFDLMAAVAAVSRTDANTRYMAAQMLYGGIGGAYTPEVLTAAEILEIAPSRSNRERYVRELYGVSPDAALNHVLALDSKSHRHEQVEAIARWAALEDLVQAEVLAENIDDSALRRRYLEIVYGRLSRESHTEATIKLFALRDGGKATNIEEKAFSQLVRKDLDSALELYEQLDNDAALESLGTIVAARLAAEDPHRALQWARNTAENVRKSLERAVIIDIAVTDVVLALQEADNLESEVERRYVTDRVISKVAEQAPQTAAEQIGAIGDLETRRAAARTVASKWLEEDAFAAIDWVLSSDHAVQTAVFRDRDSIRRVDLDEAQALVGALPRKYRASWARSVAERLVAERSPEDAIRFVSQFSGQPGYDMQMANVVAKIGQEDSDAAAQWIDRIPDGYARDGAVSAIVRSQLGNNPVRAAALLATIDDAAVRQDSAGSVAMTWLQTDPSAARRWIDTMPRGTERDNVLFNAAVGMYQQTELQAALIEDIDDAEIRQQAIFMSAMAMSRDDPEKLLQQLEQLELPEVFKQQIKAQILRQSVRGR